MSLSTQEERLRILDASGDADATNALTRARYRSGHIIDAGNWLASLDEPGPDEWAPEFPSAVRALEIVTRWSEPDRFEQIAEDFGWGT